MKILSRIPKSITFLFWMTVLTGLIYPLAVTVVAQLAFPRKANGSLIVIGGTVRGSTLLAQKVETARYFRARPSATDYVYLGSGASNLAATNSALNKASSDNRSAWIKYLGETSPGQPVPSEMLYASASGLDPEISLAAALAEAETVARARGFSDTTRDRLIDLVRRSAASSTTLIGVPRVNVEALNEMLETDPLFRGTR